MLDFTVFVLCPILFFSHEDCKRGKILKLSEIFFQNRLERGKGSLKFRTLDFAKESGKKKNILYFRRFLAEHMVNCQWKSDDNKAKPVIETSY